MIRNIGILVFGAEITAAPTYSQDLSRYREFQLGTNLPAVAKQIRVKPSDAKAIHERPAMIQELEWRAPLLVITKLSALLETFDSEPAAISSFYLHVWARQQGRWRLVAGSSTRIEQTKP